MWDSEKREGERQPYSSPVSEPFTLGLSYKHEDGGSRLVEGNWKHRVPRDWGKEMEVHTCRGPTKKTPGKVGLGSIQTGLSLCKKNSEGPSFSLRGERLFL